MSEDTMDTPTPQEGEDKTKENEQANKEKSLEAQKEHFRKKFEDAQKEIEILKTKEVNNVSKPNNEEYNSRLDRIEFAQSHPELGAEVVQEVLDLAKSKGIKAEEALELPMVKTYVDTVKSERAVANATPTGGRSPRVQPKKPISEMSRDERIEHLKKLVG